MLETLLATRSAISDAADLIIALTLAGAGLAVATGSFVAHRSARANSTTGIGMPIKSSWALVLLIDAIMIFGAATVLLVL